MAAASSEYFEQLSAKSKERYLQKITKIGGVDPYTIKDVSKNEEDFPDVGIANIVLYLLHSKSAGEDELNSWKGLSAHNNFVNGWVKEIGVKVFNDIIVIIGRVLHSQRLSDSATKTWIISERGGKICSAHCDCMAGLGEGCSHIGSLLFYVEATKRITSAKTVTDSKAYWMVPSSPLSGNLFSELSEINFTAPKTLKRHHDGSMATHTKPPRSSNYDSPTSDKLSSFFKELSLVDSSSPGILSLIPPFDEKYVPRKVSGVLPKVFNDFYNVHLNHFGLEDMRKYCSGVLLSIENVTVAQQHQVEELTRLQAKSTKWFEYRAGRITASKIYSAVHTNPEKPSLSVLTNICYPLTKMFSTDATKWGIQYEKTAIEKYDEYMKVHHDKFSVLQCGLVLSTEYPYIAATPDGLVSCSCCGDGCIEVKCPYKHRDNTIMDAVHSDQRFCLELVDNTLRLKKTHAYYYQVQCQIHVCVKKYCDFIVFTNKEMHIERVDANPSFWLGMALKSKFFFEKCILPELVGKYFTVERQVSVSAGSMDDSQYCICNGGEGELYPCNNKDCERKLYHLKCVNLVNKPRKKWLCPYFIQK